MRSRHAVTKVGCLVALLLFGGVFYFGLPAGQAYWRYLQYRNAMRDAIRFRGNVNNARITSHLRTVADSLGLPEEAGILTIDRQKRILTIEADYDETWKLPGYEKRIRFQPRASGPY